MNAKFSTDYKWRWEKDLMESCSTSVHRAFEFQKIFYRFKRHFFGRGAFVALLGLREFVPSERTDWELDLGSRQVAVSAEEITRIRNQKDSDHAQAM